MIIEKQKWTEIWFSKKRYMKTYKQFVYYNNNSSRLVGSKFWFSNEKKYRKNAPTEIYENGDMFWELNNKQHRIDGPSNIWKDRKNLYYFNDVEMAEQQYWNK